MTVQEIPRPSELTIIGPPASNFRVLMLYPNIQSETMVPPSLALFSAILKREGFKVALFDTTDYNMETGFVNSDRVETTNLTFRPYKPETEKKTTDAYDDLRKLVESFGPNLILVTATENMFPMAINLLKHIDDCEVPAILGGVFATFAPELCMRWKEIDILCVGEGEYALVELCRRMSKGRDYSDVPSLWVRLPDGSIKKNPISTRVDMDKNPLPDFSIFETSRFRRPMAGKMRTIFPIETHRGCPYTCRFCNSPSQDLLYSSMTKQAYFRKKSFPEVRQELLFCRDVWKAEYFLFWADTFFAWSEKEFDEFCEMYKDIGLPFWCQTRPETVVEHRIKKLKDIGISRMGFGVEHGNEKYRKEVIDRAYTNELVINKMKIPSELGVEFSVNNIVGFPDETRELAFDTIELNRNIKSDTMSCSIFAPFCGTELRTMAVARGYLHPDTICPSTSDDTVMDMPPPYFSSYQLKALRRVFAMYVKFPKSRWREIQKAEALTPEGDEVWARLREEFVQTFFNPDGDIENTTA